VAAKTLGGAAGFQGIILGARVGEKHFLLASSHCLISGILSGNRGVFVRSTRKTLKPKVKVREKKKQP
jgi:hypothetical protein